VVWTGLLWPGIKKKVDSSCECDNELSGSIKC
jgi:hypothetical protein